MFPLYNKAFKFKIMRQSQFCTTAAIMMMMKYNFVGCNYTMTTMTTTETTITTSAVPIVYATTPSLYNPCNVYQFACKTGECIPQTALCNKTLVYSSAV